MALPCVTLTVVPNGSGARDCWPGVFAVGDVRSGSTKMVAPAVGEGGMAVRFVAEHLARAPRRGRGLH